MYKYLYFHLCFFKSLSLFSESLFEVIYSLKKNCLEFLWNFRMISLELYSYFTENHLGKNNFISHLQVFDPAFFPPISMYKFLKSRFIIVTHFLNGEVFLKIIMMKNERKNYSFIHICCTQLHLTKYYFLCPMSSHSFNF